VGFDIEGGAPTLRPNDQRTGASKAEIRRRTRVARLFPNEASCLQLVSAVLMEISKDWQKGKVPHPDRLNNIITEECIKEFKEKTLLYPLDTSLRHGYYCLVKWCIYHGYSLDAGKLTA
jgi:hypothetical protein